MIIKACMYRGVLVFNLKDKDIIKKALPNLDVDSSILGGSIHVAEDKCLRYNLLYTLSTLAEVETIELS